MTKPLRPMRYLVIALVLLFTLASMRASYAAGRVFFDDFESGTTSQWAKQGYHDWCKPVSKAVDGGAPHSGSIMLQCNWNGIVPWSDPAAYEGVALLSWNYSKEFLVRVWMRLDKDVDPKEGLKAFRLYNGGSGVINSYVLAINNQISGRPGLSVIETVDGKTNTNANYDAGFFGDFGWHKVEWYFNIALSGGSIFRMWVDGKLVHERKGWSADPSNKWYPLALVSNWTNNPGWEHDASNHIYWDNIEIYSDAGTGAIGSMSDASINNGASAVVPPPQNVRLTP